MKLNIQWRFLAIGFACLIFLPAQSSAQSTEADPLVTLNSAFRVEYVKAKADALSKVGPLIIVEGNKVVLQRNGQRTEAEILPPMYLSLKAIAHVPLAVFLVFEQLGNDKLTDSRIAELQGYRKLILAARESLGQRGFTDVQLERQHKIIN